MCGILGLSRGPKSRLTDEQVKILLAILVVQMDGRGGDSWGAWADGKLFHGVGKATYGMDLNDFIKARNMFLHTRKATIGEPILQNAHPFQKNHIIGCHNGSVTNWQALNRKYDRDCKVDSEHIFAHIAEGRPMSEICGWGTICWHDDHAEDKRINLCKFNGGDLAVYGTGDVKDEEGPYDIVWASTNLPIQWGLALAGSRDSFSYNIPQEVRHHVKNGQLYTDEPGVMRFGSRHEYSYGGGSQRTFTPLQSNQTQRPKKDGDRDTLTKQFVATRKGLEGYYKDEWCTYCLKTEANVKCLTTMMLYCISCWEQFEKIKVFKGSLKMSQRMTCEVCDTDKATIYSGRFEELLCSDCANIANYKVVEDELMYIPQQFFPLSETTAARCSMCHVIQAEVWEKRGGANGVGEIAFHPLCLQCFKITLMGIQLGVDFHSEDPDEVLNLKRKATTGAVTH